MHANHERARLNLQAEERAQSRAKLTQLRDEYFANSQMQCLGQQLDGELKPQEDMIGRELVFPERARIANAFFSTQSFSEIDDFESSL